jgi:peptide methionine sulfoxide reductase msrA/msrB
VKRVPDADGRRTEIVCAKCGAHLGHVFLGEELTPKNTRHCVNSISMNFIPAVKTSSAAVAGEAAGVAKGTAKESVKPDTAIFAGGCFWGVEYYFSKAEGVLSTAVGYIGGRKDHPSYEEVSSHKTGHAEAVEVAYDPSKTTYENLARLFFEIHDFTQVGRQGPDIGDQYRSVVFYGNGEQKKSAEKLIEILNGKGYKVATKVVPAGKFWKAEEYHQEYYEKNGHKPYCHVYRKIF